MRHDIALPPARPMRRPASAWHRGLRQCALLLGLALATPWLQAEPGGTARTRSLNLSDLDQARQQWLAGDPAMVRSMKSLRQLADDALLRGPYSVIHRPFASPSSNPNDFVAYAGYTWPNPSTPDGLPWIFRDGHHNPDAALDWIPFTAMTTDVERLSLAYHYLGDERHAAHAAALLRAWFITAETRQTAHMRLSRIVPGSANNNVNLPPFLYSLTRLCDAAGLLEASPHWTADDRRAFAGFLKRFVAWLERNGQALADSRRTNNHGSTYRVGQVAIHLYLGNDAAAAAALQRWVDEWMPLQFAADGTQPQEMPRADNLNYHVVNLGAAITLAQLAASMPGTPDLWRHVTPAGGSLRKSTDFLLPYLTLAQPWPHYQQGQFTLSAYDRWAVLRRAALGFDDPALAAAADAALGGTRANVVLDLSYPAAAVGRTAR